MAALHLHNAIHPIPQSPDFTPTSSVHPHTRTLSANTLHTSASSRPLLRPNVSVPLASHDPEQGEDTVSPTLGLNLLGDSPTQSEKRNEWLEAVKKRLKRLRLAKSILEVVIGSWVIYNLVRYIMSYYSYERASVDEGASVAISLGSSAAISITLIIASTLIAIFHTRLLVFDIPNRHLQIARIVMHNFSSIFLLIPAIVNLVLVFTWKNSPVSGLRVTGRCHFDVDVVWSGPASQCDGSHFASWDVWLTSSVIRLALTISILSLYHVTARAYHLTRRPSQHRSSRIIADRVSRHSVHSHAGSLAAFPEMSVSSVHGSLLRLPSGMPSRTSLDTQSRVGENPMEHHSLRRQSIRVSSRPISDASDLTEDDLLGLRETESLASRHTRRSSHSRRKEKEREPSPPCDATADDGHEAPNGASSFANHYLSVVDQVGRDTLEGMSVDYPRPGSVLGFTESASPSEGSHSSGYEHMDLPEHPVRFVGGYLRRMPTIESLGSKEHHSASPVASSAGHRTEGGVASVTSHQSHSRSTRTNTLGSGSHHSDPSTRSNSLPLGHVAENERTGSGEGEPEVIEQPGRPSISQSSTSFHTAMSSPSPHLERADSNESIS